jgi:hypothetical protein
VPLPAGGNTPWPPKVLQPVYGKINVWSAWYSGEPEQLSAVYGGTQSYNDATGFFASQQGGFTARVRRTLQRWFWGANVPRGEQRTKLHIPLAGDIASTSADLLFSEPPTVSVDDTGTQDRLNDLIDDGVHANLIEAAEIAAALGGVYLRVCWDRGVSDRPWLHAVHPDAAVPEWTWGRLSAATFWRVLSDDGSTVVRHLERHEPGRILHGVYEGDSDTLGHLVPFAEYADTAWLAEVVNEGNEIPTGLADRLTAVYVPNMRPNRCWRNMPAAASLGRSDYAGTEPLMDALDETWTSWMRDLRLAKARLVVPSVYLQANGPGQGASFDLDQEIYEGLNVLPGKDAGQLMSQVQFAIRVEEHERTAAALVTNIVRDSGYSAQTFGMQGDTSITATEVTARERKSFITRDKKTRYWRPQLQEITETLLMIDAAVFSSGVTPERPTIEFGDSVSEDPEAQARTLQLLEAARAASIETKVRMLHPDWEDKDVTDEVNRIKAETGAAPLVNPDNFTGNGPGLPADPSASGA